MTNMNKMMKYADICMAELDVIGIPYRTVVNWKISKAKHMFGYCRNLGNNTFEITISTIILENGSIDGLKNTIIHELLHTCDGCMNHKTNWKRMAERVNNYYGYNIKRTDSYEGKGIDASVNEKDKKYKITCANCGYSFFRERFSKVVSNTNSYRCGACRVGKLVVTCLDDNYTLLSAHN